MSSENNYQIIDPIILDHLIIVYCYVGTGLMSCSVGVMAHLVTGLEEWANASTLLTLGLLVAQAVTDHTPDNLRMRQVMFLLFTFIQGVSLGPVIELVTKIVSRVIVHALALTAALLLVLTAVALINTERSMLQLSEWLWAAFFFLIVVGMGNMYLGSTAVVVLYLASSLVLFLLFYIHDTQLIIVKRSAGKDDYIWHSVLLFLDVFQIFKLILVILAKREYNKIVESGRTHC